MAASLLSEAYSVYTEVTSILASDASNTASSTSTTPSSASTTSSSSSTTASSSSSSSIHSTSSKATSSRPSSLANAAATSSAASSSSGGVSGRNLAIILGCILGALALGLLLLILVLCCRRRRHRSRSPRLLSPDGEEIESWRIGSQRPGSRRGLLGGPEHDNAFDRGASAGIPDMAEHPAFRNEQQLNQNPFVPEPPAPRRSAPNSRAGLTDGAVPGQEPFINNSNGTSGEFGSNGMHRKNHHAGEELAAGAGGAALGAAALHHHNKTREQNDGTSRYSSDQKQGFHRTPLENNTYPTTTTNDDAFALNKVPSRRSGEQPPPFNSDDYGYPYVGPQQGLRQPSTSAPLSPFNSAGHVRGPTGDHSHNAVLAAGAGALGGAALAHNHHKHQASRSPRRSYDSAKTPGPNAFMTHHSHPIPDNQTNDLVSPISSDSYSSAINRQEQRQSIPYQHQHQIPAGGYPPHDRNTVNEMPADVPTPTPSSSTRRSFGARPLSTGPPAAAALAYPNHRRNQTPPAVPSRSPKRTRFSDEPQIADTTAGMQHDSSHTTSDDSTWRLSSGMPGGWARNSDSQRRDSFDSTRNAEHLRNSGINPQGRNESRSNSLGADGRRSISPGGRQIQGQGRRLRLADLKREEEERERGRQSMGTEWGGNGGYDGYEQGVGRAM